MLKNYLKDYPKVYKGLEENKFVPTSIDEISIAGSIKIDNANYKIFIEADEYGCSIYLKTPYRIPNDDKTQFKVLRIINEINHYYGCSYSTTLFSGHINIDRYIESSNSDLCMGELEDIIRDLNKALPKILQQ